MYPSVSLHNESVLTRLLEALERFDAFMPTHWGHDELTRLNYDPKELIEQALSKQRPRSEIHLHRTKAAQYSGYFDLHLSFRAYLHIKFTSVPRALWPQFFELSDGIANVVQPRFGIAHMFWPSTIPWQNERQRLHRWMNFAAQTAPVNFGPKGPLGLGNRTYMNGEMIELFGKEAIQSAPVIRKELDWNGVRLDIADPLWEAAPEELLDSWLQAMEHLRSTEVIAAPTFSEDRRTVHFEANQQWKTYISQLTK